MTGFYGAEYPDPVEVDPFTPTEDGEALLDDVRALLARFVAFPSEDALIAVTLWVAHTHAMNAFETTPRLALLSPEPGSGKTRALEIIELLVPRPLLTVNVTPAYLFRKVAEEAGPPTILFDEIDTVFGPRAKENEDIRGMLNAGYRRGATAGRCIIRGKSVEVEELPAYAAAALAGLDDLPDTIMTRSIVVRMRRRAPHEVVEPYRRRVHAADGHALRDRLGGWIAQVWQHIDGAWPKMPDGIHDRNADVWEPLLTIADAAGGHWPESARCSAVSLVSAVRDNGGSLGIRLLADLRSAFTSSGVDKLATEAVLEALYEMDESPWGDLRGKPLDSRGLSRRLAKYGVHPKQIRTGERTCKGYDRADLHDAWTRYLPAVVSLSDDTTTKPDLTDLEGQAQHETPAPPLGPARETSETPKHSEPPAPARGHLTPAAEASEVLDALEHDDRPADAAPSSPNTPNAYAPPMAYRPPCPHDVLDGEQPDPFVGGRARCPQCRAEQIGAAS